jgi:hypothetical protein
MKNIYTYLSLVIIALLTSCSTTNYPQSYTSESSDVTYQQFYNDLSPYGDWVDYQNYGYVWVPNEMGFRPYYNNGQWIYTDYGWTWVSNYNWGWAPFHYGRWLYDYAYGWMWVPGYQWAPAWVSWRSGGDYYGWAPLGPGMDINSDYGSNIPYNNWSFVPCRYINSPRVNNYYVDRQQNVNIINNTTIINNTRVINNNNVYIAGPSASEVERNTHQKLNTVKIVQRNKPGDAQVSGNKLTMYKPAIKDVPQQTRTIKPAKLSNLNDVKLRHERTEGGNDKFPAKDDSRKELNPTDRVQPDVNTEKNNIPPLINHQREIGQPQKTNNDQKVQPNPADIKKDSSVPDNERLNRQKENQQDMQKRNAETERLNSEKENQQRIQQQNAENERLNREKENQQRIQQNNKNLPVEKPLPIQENTDKKTDQSNTRRFQNQNNNPQPPVKNNPPAKVRNMNQPNSNPVNKPVIKPQPNNEKLQNNNIQPIRKNLPDDKPPVNNQPPRIKNENPSIIIPKHEDPQQKEKKE